MAGTSPDRSKRYESSTESTSGNEPAVPDPGGSVPGQSSGPTPDPRLAMSRPSAPKPDQATAVFSRRALLEAAETEALKRNDAPGSADADADADTGRGAPKTAGTLRNEPDAEGAAGAGAAAGDPNGSQRDAAPDDADSPAEDGGRADDDSPADDSPAEVGATRERTDESVSASATAADTDREPTPADRPEDDDAHPRGRDAAAAADAGEAGGGAGAGAGKNTRAETDAAADGEETGDDASSADPAPAAEAKANTAPATGTGAAEAGRETVDGAEATAEDVRQTPDADREAPDNARKTTGGVQQAPDDTPEAPGAASAAPDEARSPAEATGGAGPAADAPGDLVDDEPTTADDVREAAGDAGKGPDEAGDLADDEPGAVVDAREAAGDAKASADEARDIADDLREAAGAAGAAAADARDLPDDEPGAADEVREAADDAPEAGDAGKDPDDARDLADDEPGAVVDAREAAGDAKVAADEVRDPADDEPVAAGGEVAPQGPPAGDDESRTGGAGGGAGGDGGAEAAVDQPTAIFRAPRLPAVDQPTTMLKLGDAAPRDAEPAKADAAPEDAEPAKADAPSDRAGVSTDADSDRRTDDDKGADSGKGAQGGVGVDEPAPPAERTSKFVALKPLDETTTLRPPAAAPHPAPPAPAEATRALPQVGPERTTQQPLPPKPPLDLLAELTNTPPPRQTPVRTFIRRVKIWTPLLILLVIVFAVVQAVRPLPTPTLALTADASYAFEGDKVSLPWPAEGQGWMDVNGIGTVDSFGEQKPVAIGSVAKAMTAYVILKDHPMKAGEKGATIPVDAKAETEGGYDKDGESTLNTVKEGDQLSQYDAIAAIMIPSANNIARLLARWDSNGSEEAFVKKMNAAAKDLGMKNTTYTDPSGLKETTVSTAEDQVKLGNALVKMKALTDITRLPEWKDPSGLKHRNYNTLVPYDNAIGIKTGSTTAAGGNLLFAATKEVGGETAIVVGAILGQHTPPIIDTVNAVSKTAMVAAQDAVTSDTILKKGDVVGYVDDGLGGRTPVVATKNVAAVGWAGKTVKLELDASATIPNEAKSGTEVGTLIVGDGAGEGVEVPVALQKPLTEPDFLTRLTRVS
ncbi:D-alanyl-D-alanine carboxypeptidase family protein [Streptomyces deccanensis]|uniref:D-alanyl-D-alanine carboxypeptidase family protein n=1 Tax=Streptomyces deccanensis TaxID=424188 RepID=UPI001EFAFB61|nr:D-alanyl-D-alanine carboxypeptidase [Streptomyces deccanensis]ULR51324.1 D-alanyl-D-alanine carboxypeptidase [Streptomyces deccanensis]